ncbi:hypothetical protein [Actinomadura rubrisoli]|uniref:Uncharacterized protein n=1 Tax=Actinomadura rubrisoli TaxID=2530368 RepID=A0A4R5B6A2_9ACTN|nr:hypothetical protein [Actinomadura rubrisoli]TDD81381.1 hypothetical protein E1298_24185 [Actinomadura rubrisoli]
MTAWDEDALACLRAAAQRGDGAGGLAALAGRPLGPVLQYAGDVLVAALAEGLDAARPRARECVEALDGRGLPGDAELAAELTAALEGPGTGLPPVPADLGAVAAALEDADPHVLDLARGDVLALDELTGDEPAGDEPAGEPSLDHADAAYDPGRWLPIPPGAVPDEDEGTPGDAQEAREDARRGRARKWLADHGYRPAPRTL